jgi:hypothetical protein
LLITRRPLPIAETQSSDAHHSSSVAHRSSPFAQSSDAHRSSPVGRLSLITLCPSLITSCPWPNARNPIVRHPSLITCRPSPIARNPIVRRPSLITCRPSPAAHRSKPFVHHHHLLPITHLTLVFQPLLITLRSKYIAQSSITQPPFPHHSSSLITHRSSPILHRYIIHRSTTFPTRSSGFLPSAIRRPTTLRPITNDIEYQP